MLDFSRVQGSSVTRVPLAIHLLRSREVRDRYWQSLEQRLSQVRHNAEGSAEEQWQTLKDCIMTSAEEAVGCARKKQSDWFIDATDVLAPLLDDKIRAHQRYLLSQCSSTKKEFRQCQRLVKKAVDEAKEVWISKVIDDAEHSKDGKLWQDCIKKLQTTFSGRRPRSVRLQKQDGSLTVGPEELIKNCWMKCLPGKQCIAPFF